MSNDQADITRRSLLRAVGAVCLLGPGGCGERDANANVAVPLQPLENLDLAGFSVVVQSVPLVSGTDELSAVAAAQRIDGAMSVLPMKRRYQYRALLQVIDNLSPLLTSVNRPYSNMSSVEKAEALQGMQSSRSPQFVAAYHALCGLCLGATYTDPRTWAFLGYPGVLGVGEVFDDSKDGAAA